MNNEEERKSALSFNAGREIFAGIADSVKGIPLSASAQFRGRRCAL
jgi:hypothetical protein